MIRDQQFKMMISPDEKHRIINAAQLKGISQADVMRLAFREFEKKIQREVSQDPKPAQEQPASL